MFNLNGMKLSICGLILFGALPIFAQAATINVACPGNSLQSAVDAATPGDTLNVSGTCTENVLIRNDKSRITINGQGTAILNPASASTTTLTIRGKGILVYNMTINGGLNAVLVNRGSNAYFSGNTIQGASQSGVVLVNLAFAAFLNNTIQNNGSDGIFAGETSSMHVGFNEASDAAVSPNNIVNNGRYGILVTRGSSARIYGNNVSSNGLDGIMVARGSTADIASNTINANGTNWTSGNDGNGIWISLGSYATIGEPDSTHYSGMPNITTVNNANAGLRCNMNSSIYGRTGTVNQLNGAVSQIGGGTTTNTFSSTCVTDITTS